MRPVVVLLNYHRATADPLYATLQLAHRHNLMVVANQDGFQSACKQWVRMSTATDPDIPAMWQDLVRRLSA